MYFVNSGYTEPEKTQEFVEWLNSGEVEDLTAQIEEETGFKYVDTYFPILGLGEFDFETWWEMPDWATLDAIRETEPIAAFTQKQLRFVDESRPAPSRVLRTPEDVQVMEPEDN